MKPSIHLFKLVKSLNKNEKRYFSLATSKDTDRKNSIYIKLFQAIDRLAEKNETYDEQELIGLLKKENDLIQRLAFHKNYLYNKILQQLRNYYANNNVSFGLKNRTQDIRILLDKGLYLQALQLVNETKKVAREYQQHLILAELFEFEIELVSMIEDIELALKLDSTEYKEARKAVDAYGTYLNFLKLRNRLGYLTSHNVGLSKAEIATALDQLFDNGFPKPEMSSYSFLTDSGIYNMLGVYNMHQKKEDKGVELLENQIELMKKHDYIIHEKSPMSFFAAYFNLAIGYLNLGRYNDSLEIVNKLISNETIKVRSFYTEAKVFPMSYILKTRLMLLTGKFEDCLLIEDKIIKGLETYDSAIEPSRKIELLYNLSRLMCSDQKYKKALFWINKITNSDKYNTRLDIQCSAHISRLIICYELGNYDYSDLLYKPTLRFLRKSGRLFALEKKLIDFIVKKLPYQNSNKDTIELFRKFKAELNELSKNPEEVGILQYINIPGWVESKIQNKSFSELILLNQSRSSAKAFEYNLH